MQQWSVCCVRSIYVFLSGQNRAQSLNTSNITSSGIFPCIFSHACKSLGVNSASAFYYKVNKYYDSLCSTLNQIWNEPELRYLVQNIFVPTGCGRLCHHQNLSKLLSGSHLEVHDTRSPAHSDRLIIDHEKYYVHFKNNEHLDCR